MYNQKTNSGYDVPCFCEIFTMYRKFQNPSEKVKMPIRLPKLITLHICAKLLFLFSFFIYIKVEHKKREIKLRDFTLVTGGFGGGIAGGTLASSGMNVDAITVVVDDEIKRMDVGAKPEVGKPSRLEMQWLTRFKER